MAESMKTGPTSGDIARLDAKLDRLPVEKKVEIFQNDTDTQEEEEHAFDLELLALPERYLAPLLEVVNAINIGNKIDVQYEKLQCDAFHKQLSLARKDFNLPPLCRMLLHLSLAMLYAKYSRTICRPRPWYSNFKEAVRAWIACGVEGEVQPTGHLWFVMSKMMRRVREEIEDGDVKVETVVEVLDREPGWMARQFEEVQFRTYGVYEKGCMPLIWAVPGVHVPKFVEEEIPVVGLGVETVVCSEVFDSTEESDTVVPDVGQLEVRRESMFSTGSTVPPTPFDSIVDTSTEGYVSGNSSVCAEEEEKRELSPEDMYNLETVDLVFDMFNIDISGPVFRDGDLI